MVYYISDLHFGHANIIKLCNRPFSDVNEMNEALIANWNNKVTNGDTVTSRATCFSAWRTTRPPFCPASKAKSI